MIVSFVDVPNAQWPSGQEYKIASPKSKLGCASAMLLLQRIASLNGVFVVEDEQVTEEADMLMWI